MSWFSTFFLIVPNIPLIKPGLDGTSLVLLNSKKYQIRSDFSRIGHAASHVAAAGPLEILMMTPDQ